ncbi:MAG TPA: DNA alkylation repair protein [Draconibacterium sp.]|nr:DNA alkylation repair protein [Draconibacterium sp.]
MDFILDNQETETKFRRIITLIKSRKSGEVAELMDQKGINYKLNWGVSIIELREIAKQFEHNHLLALKLWNKQWRETMILATLIDEPELVTEEQIDFWTKSIENSEIAEQVSANLWVHTKFAFVKAMEWCRGKKHFVRYTGVHLIGRLALTEKSAIDEMFEPFFDELPILAKDSMLNAVFYRTIIALGKRSEYLNQLAVKLTRILLASESENAASQGKELHMELTSDYFRDMVKK